MNDDFATLTGTLHALWHRCERATQDASGPARHVALATRGRTGGAEARMVVLRDAERVPGRLRVHTHRASAKVNELAADPAATLLLWDAEARFQTRLRVTVSMRTGSHADWTTMPDNERLLYTESGPGRALESPEEAASDQLTPSAEAFRVLDLTIVEIETLHLERDLQRRAIFTRCSGFQGVWITP